MNETIRLNEYRDWDGPLADGDTAYIETALRQFSLRRPLHGSGYVLNPNQFVGVVVLPSGRRIEVRPKVPISSLFRMLAVAYRLPSPFRDEVIEFDDFDEVFEFVAAYFADLVDARLRAGLYRAYVEEEDNLSTLRGRVMIAEDLRRNVITRHHLYCRYSEFTWDVPENQIVRQVVAMLRFWGFGPALTQRLAELDLSMSEITPTHHTVSVIDQFQYRRFTADYEPLHQLCRFFLDGSSLSELAGSTPFRSFLIDMNRLFEEFVTQSFLDRAGETLHVRPQWSSHLDQRHLITIRPDLVVETAGRAILAADCKYKRTLPDDYGNADNYQVVAYCTALGITRGMLIYPRYENVTDHEIEINRSPITISQRTVDLSGSATEMDRTMDALWNDIAETARRC